MEKAHDLVSIASDCPKKKSMAAVSVRIPNTFRTSMRVSDDCEGTIHQCCEFTLMDGSVVARKIKSHAGSDIQVSDSGLI